MKAGILFTALATSIFSFTQAQDRCASVNYLQAEQKANPLWQQFTEEQENFIRHTIEQQKQISRGESTIIYIPVVVHILYHNPEEKISDAQVNDQIAMLNTCFRRRNSDTTTTPAHFRALAADCEIEFKLAISDPRRRSTTGITRTYTPITKWGADDKMKFASEMGVNAWDTKQYLNIWVCNLDKFAGYASFPGGDLAKDGIVLSYKVVGNASLGKTAVHEAGHWLGLKHIWGDAYCGTDEVEDTPKQASYTIGCPNTVRVTCGNSPYGDMYMNYMDLTNDACTNMFTQGQKQRMLALFAFGGYHNGILTSVGLQPPTVMEIPLPGEPDPKWLQPKLYPNPANSSFTLDLSYDSRWIGQNIFVTNLSGQNVMNVIVRSKIATVDISRLAPGLYFLAAKKPDGESMRLKFVKH